MQLVNEADKRKRKNSNLMANQGPYPDLSLVYVTVNIVDPIMLIGNAHLMANHVNCVAKRTICQEVQVIKRPKSEHQWC